MVVVVITKGPLIVFGFSKTCESDCQSIKIRFMDGLVTQFLLEWNCNVGSSSSEPAAQFSATTHTASALSILVV